MESIFAEQRKTRVCFPRNPSAEAASQLLSHFSRGLTLPPVLTVTQDATGYTSMRPRELEAFQLVANQCSRDVAYFCNIPDSQASFAASVDTKMLDLGSVLDSFFSSALQTAPEVNNGAWMLVWETNDAAVDIQESRDENMMNHVLSHLAAHTDLDRMEELSNQVRSHGQMLMERAETSHEQRRMARRLTEASPDVLIEHRRTFLPFGCIVNRCLEQAYASHLVSPPCGLAMQGLEHVRAVQHLQNVQRDEEQEYMLTHLAVLYFFVLLTIVTVHYRRSSELKRNRRLKHRIFRAIYSKPTIKAALEQEMGESIGHVPPLRWQVLSHWGLYGQQFRKLVAESGRIRVVVGMVIFLCFCLTVALAPLNFMMIAPTMAAFGFWSAACSKAPTPVCACCCCGATTEDAKDGTLTEEQACCSCCSGTGVCSLQCPSCCGNEDDAKSGGSCCCCCGATPEDAKEGTLTEEQACCSCCSGSGVCSSKGASGCGESICSSKTVGGCCSGGCCAGSCCTGSCCSSGCCCCAGGTSCGQGCCCKAKKDAATSTTTTVYVYEGIPVQIV